MKVQGTITIDGVNLYDVTGYMRRDDDNEPRIELNNSNGSIIAMLYVEDIKYCEVNEQDEDGRYTGETISIIDDGEIVCDKLL
mgnify:CR=1 FL=1